MTNTDKLILSIIIPVYNVEKYLEHCIESCIHQKIYDYEIILVNDGSTDNSLNIVGRYNDKYNHITIISQENKGLSIARNNGLSVAKGEYVWFVDSDDWIECNCLEEIYKVLIKNQPDILQLQYQLVYEDGHIEKSSLCLIEGDKNGKEVLINGGLPDPAQFSIYKRQFLLENNLLFYPKIYHEDSEFKPRATYYAKSIVSYDKVVYNYFQRSSGSITSNFKLKNAVDILTVNQSLYDFSENVVVERQIKKCFYRSISINFNTLFFGIRQLNESELKIIEDLLYKNRHLLRVMIKSGNAKYVLEGVIFMISIRLGLTLHKLIR